MSAAKTGLQGWPASTSLLAVCGVRRDRLARVMDGGLVCSSPHAMLVGAAVQQYSAALCNGRNVGAACTQQQQQLLHSLQQTIAARGLGAGPSTSARPDRLGPAELSASTNQPLPANSVWGTMHCVRGQ